MFLYEHFIDWNLDLIEWRINRKEGTDASVKTDEKYLLSKYILNTIQDNFLLHILYFYCKGAGVFHGTHPCILTNVVKLQIANCYVLWPFIVMCSTEAEYN